MLWDFHDARDNPIGSLDARNLIFAIELRLVDNCLLGPAPSATRKAAGSSSGLAAIEPGLAPAREIGPAPDLYHRAVFA